MSFLVKSESQAEAHEIVIHDVSNLCDIAEAVCDAQEQQMKQSYFDMFGHCFVMSKSFRIVRICQKENKFDHGDLLAIISV